MGRALESFINSVVTSQQQRRIPTEDLDTGNICCFISFAQLLSEHVWAHVHFPSHFLLTAGTNLCKWFIIESKNVSKRNTLLLPKLMSPYCLFFINSNLFNSIRLTATNSYAWSTEIHELVKELFLLVFTCMLSVCYHMHVNMRYSEGLGAGGGTEQKL